MTATATIAIVPAQAKEILLIDLSHLFRSAWAIAESSQDYSGVFQQTLDGVRRCIGQRDALVGICCDGRGSWRKELYPEYKANRDAKPASMYDTLRKVKERLAADALLLWEVDTFEADDVIATAARAAMRAGHPKITIASNDKDLLQLMNDDGVRYLKTSSWDELDATQALAKFAVQPWQVVDYLALVGDTSDHIPGVPGVGAKRAAELLAKWESWEGILNQMTADASKVSTPAVVKAIAEHVEAVELGRKLIQLRADVPIKFEEIYEVRKQRPIAKGIPPMPGKNQVDFDDARISAPPPANAATPEATPAPEVEADVTPPAEKSLATQDATPAPASVALVPHTPTSFDLQLEPQTPGQAVNLAARLHNARLYTWLPNEDAVLAVVMRGREAGLPAGVALETFRPVQGKMGAIWQYIVDQCHRHPDCEYLRPVELTDTSATWEGKHRKHSAPFKETVTIEEMQKTGLIKPNSAWVQRPRQQLSKECAVRLGRFLWPGATAGLYSVDELGGDE